MAAVVSGDRAVDVEAALEEVSKAVGGQPDDSVLDLSSLKEKRIKQVFQISEAELKAVQKNGDMQEALVSLVVERVALLATQL
jgi:hypothetical protein